VRFLLEWQGKRSTRWIAREMFRPPSSVAQKLNRLGLSRLVSEGYTERALGRCFGVDSHVVARWVERGWIRGQRDGTARANDVLRFSEERVRRFVKNHPLEFRLDKVDQVWFLGLLLGPPFTKKEEAA
jgi:hypothetical protein